MVLLAAAICSRDGKALLSRQFVEMTRSRIEGLLSAFPKLIGTGKQHTFIETESVRYVYQPLERLYVVLITTKASNILEDLETLRLFARVIPEYARGTEEPDIVNDAFQIIFAFDEIVALGYRESVNLAQIRTFTEMDSHEERVFQAVRQTQIHEAQEKSKRKQRELDQQRREATRRGGMGRPPSGFGSNSSSGSMASMSGGSPMLETLPSARSQHMYGRHAGGGAETGGMRPDAASISGSRTQASVTKPTGRGMQLGSKARDVDTFVDQLKAEGEVVTEAAASAGAGRRTGSGSVSSAAAMPLSSQEKVHVRIEEKLTVQAGRDGGLNNMELVGILQVKVSHADLASVRLKVDAGRAAQKGAQLQTHPNIEKKVFQSSGWVQAKSTGKPYPLGQEVGVLKWRLQTQEESMVPLTINCWPNQSASGCDVNIEYELQDTELELHEVVITIPLPPGCAAPVVNECDGEYAVDSRRGQLDWRLPLINSENRSGSLEFGVKGGTSTPDHFFPVQVAFTSDKAYSGIQVETVVNQDNTPVKFSKEVAFFPDKYEIA